MKNNLLKISFVLLYTCSAYAQQIRHKLGTSPTIMFSSAVIEVESSIRGFLPPRMTSVQRDAIVSPATGLFCFI
jgi:hypothetical protein